MGYLLWQDLAESARRYPSRPAVVHRDSVLTYRELDDQSTRLAALLAEHGIGRGSRVGLLMPKSHRSVVAMLGILKAGAAYVPVDPHAPARRAAFILGDCGVRGLVTTTQKLEDLAPELLSLDALETVLLADDAPAGGLAGAPAGGPSGAPPGGPAGGPSGAPAGGPSGTPPSARIPHCHRWQDLDRVRTSEMALGAGIESDPAYLLYTSGSTGKPKGVILSHRHALTFVEWGAETFAVTPEDRLSNHAPHHFDLSVFDIYVALRAGACVEIVPARFAPFPVELARWIEERGISIWYSVPSALTQLLLHGKLERFDFARLRTVLFAGEVFPVKYLRGAMDRFRHASFYNLYGPTETNVCTYYPVSRDLKADAPGIPIGKACANTEVFVLDGNGRAAAPGAEGELYVRGPAVMLGYWGQPEKTREMIVTNPLQPAFSEVAYRTGDLVRMEADGTCWFVGRRDHMIKSRGYRIELGEVEQVIYEHPAVKEAVVVAIPDEEIGSRLQAIVVLHGPGTTPADLTSFCLSRLPRYMVPESFTFESELPRTSTGKTDRVMLSQRLAAAR